MRESRPAAKHERVTYCIALITQPTYAEVPFFIAF